MMEDSGIPNLENHKRALVVEDNEENRRAALLIHNNRGYSVHFANDFYEAASKLGLDSFRPPEHGFVAHYDALLTDLTIPLSDGSGDAPTRNDVTKKRALGYSLALLASRVRVKNIAILTSTNHHDDPHAASWDYLYESNGWQRPVHNLNGSRFALLDERDISWLVPRLDGGYSSLSEFYEFDDKERVQKFQCRQDGGFIKPAVVKNWPGALEYLLKEGSR